MPSSVTEILSRGHTNNLASAATQRRATTVQIHDPARAARSSTASGRPTMTIWNGREFLRTVRYGGGVAVAIRVLSALPRSRSITQVCTDVSRAAIGSDVTLSVTLIPDEAFFARPWNSSTRIGSDVTLSVTQIPNTGSVQHTQASGHSLPAECSDTQRARAV